MNQKVDKYLAVSTAVRDASMIGAGKSQQPIEVVPTFIADTVLEEARHIERPAFLPPADNYILYVGRQAAIKGLDVLLEAYAELSDLAPLVLMITDFGEKPRRFPEGVIVARNVPHAQVMAGWMHCAVGVVPSIWPEPFGQVAVEAMLCGKPVVASAVGGLRDVIIDGKTGLLVEPGDASGLREALRTLLLNPSKRVRMGDLGRQRARLFTVSTVTDRIEQIYAEVLNKRDQAS
jgi:glycosyltransferase involved in cell wall biosynthesis